MRGKQDRYDARLLPFSQTDNLLFLGEWNLPLNYAWNAVTLSGKAG